MAQINNGGQGITNVAQDLDIGKYLEIRFHSSIRVRDHGDRDLQRIAKETLHSRSPFVLTRHGEHEQRTYLLPMRAMGALAIYIGVRPGSLHAFKICVKIGTVNIAAPGHPGLKQYYFVARDQRWIDGVASPESPYHVRQFVALDPGTDYSIEHQITGKDENGGIEIQISLGTPLHRVGRQSQSGFPIFVKGNDGKTISISNVMPEDTVSDLKRDIFTRLGQLPEEQQLRWNGKDLEETRTLGEYSVKRDSTIHLIPKVRGGAKHRFKRGMQIAPGGLIRQVIFKDPGWYQWDDEPIGPLRIEVVDYESFQKITGSSPPAPPPLPKGRIKYTGYNTLEGENTLMSIAEADKINTNTRSIGRIDIRRYGSSEDPRPRFSQRLQGWLSFGRGQRRAEDVGDHGDSKLKRHPRFLRRFTARLRRLFDRP
ncbi:hypothetical protein F5Y09DRAFT_357436 [Xylaria sp. FL1042]|nr:hypothetical protein F5Y09DRAFT_357436 [Xylaria sp. FL1042]